MDLRTAKSWFGGFKFNHWLAFYFKGNMAVFLTAYFFSDYICGF